VHGGAQTKKRVKPDPERCTAARAKEEVIERETYDSGALQENWSLCHR